jgi:hypothetical protein
MWVGWMSLALPFPTTCFAQADVSPDAYVAVVASTVQASSQAAASNQRGKSDFGGKFTLPYDVQCAGVKLPAGEYSVAVDRRGKIQTVILTHGNDTTRFPAKAVFPSSRHGSAIVVWRDGEERKLAAVYLEKMRVVLYLDSDQFLQVSSTDPHFDRLPIS